MNRRLEELAVPGLRHVALLIESSRAYGRGLLSGVARYVHTHRHWSVYVQVRGSEDPAPPWLRGWKGDGILARVEDRTMERAVHRAGVPTIDLRGNLDLKRIPLLETNDRSVARLAFEHLAARGFRQFAYCGYAGANYSERRLRYFPEFVRSLGHCCHDYQSPPGNQSGLSAREQLAVLFEKELLGWLRSLPRPTGIMACNDTRGQQVLNACRALGIAVPEEIAVIGVDNDELLCELSSPPLSSVAPDTEGIGYQAALLLDQMMDGRAAPARKTFIEPRGVVARQSTDILAIDDADVAAAVRVIREQACTGIDVADVVAQVQLSRRSLERRFRKYLGRSPNEEIVRVQVQRVHDLLTDTDLPLGTIARLAGFEHAPYMSAVFRKHTGQMPRQVRRKGRQT
jgi:LacI family transcriptional regulator